MRSRTEYTSYDFALIHGLRGSLGGMSYGMWGELWNITEFIKMKKIALSVGLKRSSALVLLCSR